MTQNMKNQSTEAEINAIIEAALAKTDAEVEEQTTLPPDQSPINDPLDPNALASALIEDRLGIVRAKGFIKALDGQLCELQLVGRRWTIHPAKTATTLGIVCLGPKPLFDHERITTAITRWSSNTSQ